MNTHALKVGAYIVIFYIACLLWRFIMTDSAVINFHLLALKTAFPGFIGYDALSIFWGAILSFGYGYIGSVVFHSLHRECCIKNDKKKEERTAPNTALLLWIVAALVIGTLVGALIARSTALFSRDYLSSSSSMMRDGGTSMMQFGDMMRNVGSMMQERGEKYNDQEMMQWGKDVLDKESEFRQKGSDMMERGNGMMNMMNMMR